jgi:hypothetical protein
MNCQHNQEHPVSRWSAGFAVIQGQRFSPTLLRGDRTTGIMVPASESNNAATRCCLRPGPSLCEPTHAGVCGCASNVRSLPMCPERTRTRWWPGRELNPRHADFQSAALPTELPGHLGRCVLDRGGRRQSTNNPKIKKLRGIPPALQAHFARNFAIFGRLDILLLAARRVARACGGPRLNLPHCRTWRARIWPSNALSIIFYREHRPCRVWSADSNPFP